MAGPEELFPGLAGMAGAGFAGLKKRTDALNLLLQDADLASRQGGAKKRAGSKAPRASSAAALRPAAGGSARGIDKSLLEDEWRLKRRPRMVAGSPVKASPSSRSTAKPVAPAVTGRAPATSERPSETVKAGLAGGSQAAVVKLASFASGGSRVGALMSYQSHQGEIGLEMSDGSMVEGLDGIQALADQWTEEATERQASKDMFMFAVTLDDHRPDEQIRASLVEVLAGHKFAWTIDRVGSQTRLQVVTTAASARRDDNGKSVRLYDNQKSLTGFEGRVAAAFGGAGAFEDLGFSHGVEGAVRYMSRLTKGGARAAELQNGRTTSGHEANLAIAKSWKRDMRSREQRDVAHVILSAKPGTDKEAFVAAARATLEREFAGHDFAFALHENRAHLHIHTVVKMQSQRGERMHPGVQDFARWRSTLAEEARQRNIPMEAASRFERANPPGYKLKDIRRVERGEASENVRRRVEAVRTQAVHVPTRPEGKERARAVAGQWQRYAAPIAAVSVEPALAEGATRLYRADRPGAAETSAPLFMRNRAMAETMAARFAGTVSYLDIPQGNIGELKPSRSDPQNIVAVSRELAATRRPLHGDDTVGKVLQLRDRTAIAAGLADLPREGKPKDSYMLSNDKNSLRLDAETSTAPSQVQPVNRGAIEMPNLETMEAARKDLHKHLQAMTDNAPPESREEILKHRRSIEQNFERGVQQQAKQEQAGGNIEGEKYVEPKPRQYDNFSAYVPEQRGEAIRYAHKYDDGSAGKVAFTDTGKRVEVNDWKDREATLAAMQLAHEKWGELNVKGPEKYKEMVLQLAAEHGYQVANPELKERFEAEKARVEAERQKTAGFEGRGGEKEKPPADASTRPFETYPGMQAERGPAPIPNEKAAEYAEAYRAVTAHKTAEVENFVNVLRETRYAEGQAGHAYENKEDAAMALAMARQHAINSIPHEHRQSFERSSAEFVQHNNGIDAQQLQSGLKRGEREAAQKIGGETNELYAKVEKLRESVREDQRSDSLDSARRTEPELRAAETALWSSLKEAAEAQRAKPAAEAALTEQQTSQSQAPASAPVRTEAERNQAYASIADRTEAEAAREAVQAHVASALHETPTDPGFRSQVEATAARQAEVAVESNPRQAMQTSLASSPEIQRLADEQAALNRETAQAEQQKATQTQTPPKDRPRGQRM